MDWQGLLRVRVEVLAVLLIFGAGLIAVLLNGSAAVIKALRGPSDSDHLQERLDAIEDKLDNLAKEIASERDARSAIP